MSDEITRLEAEITQLKASIDTFANMPDVQATMLEKLRKKQSALAALKRSSGTQAGRDVNIATNQTINNFYGDQVPDDGPRLLLDYLSAMVGECEQLRLYRLTGRRQTGGERRAAPALRLQHIYTSLTTDGGTVVVHERTRPAPQAAALLKRLKLEQVAPEVFSPEQVRVLGTMAIQSNEFPAALRSIQRTDSHIDSEELLAALADLPASTPVTFNLKRPRLVLEAIAQNPYLVLLGEPGSGKSTALRYLTLLLARRGLGEQVQILGWPADHTPVPILCPLGAVAAALGSHNGDADTALWAVLEAQLDGPQGLRAGLQQYLKGAMRRGGVLLLFDGLDELPIGPRAIVAKAVARLAEQMQRTHCVVTCRVLPYAVPGDWQLPADRWQVRTIEPLAFGQVRTFVQSWYTALAQDDPELSVAEAERRIESLTTELEARERLRPLLRSPLLLTMLAILHYNNDEVPNDRSRLYEECIQLLLERWEPVRTPNLDRPGLTERIGMPNLEIDQLRTVVHRLAFQAHDRPPDGDGRGLLDGATMEGELNRFFRRYSPNPDATTQAFLAALAEDAGLLQARADDRYAFPHLTFQEYLAACYLADQPTEMIQLAYQRWSGPESARWHEVLLLLAGRLRRQGPKAIERDALPWLELLISRRIGRTDKPATQRRRDAVLAVQSYLELGGAAAFANGLYDPEEKIERPLREAIVDLLSAPEPQISTDDRIKAAQALGTLGDPRYPITHAAWRLALEQRNRDFGKPTGYFCYMPNRAYTIGGWADGETAAQLALSECWIAQLPISVAQYRVFVEANGYATKRWWTPEGWTWRQQRDTSEPYQWNDPQYRQPNQPMSIITWYESVAYCNWLTEQLADNLPAGYAIRLPTEAEWEAAAAWDGTDQRRTYPWGAADVDLDRAVYAQAGVNAPAPIGCCPAGVAACGAIDLAGNVWEWTSSSYKEYPDQAAIEVEAFTPNDRDVPRRGGSYYQDSTNVLCGARYGNYPDNYGDSLGFRIVVAPRLNR